MKIKYVINTIVLTVALFFGFSSVTHAKLNVVSTTADFGAIAREIGGDLVNISVLAKPTEDSHFVDAKPSYIAKLARADVLIEGGAELEMGWLPPLIDGSRNSKIELGKPGHVLCVEGLALLEVPATLDRSQGDIHAMGNPHFMTDPMNARHVAKHIAAAFGAADADHITAYRQKLDAFVKRLDEKLPLWEKEMAPFKGRRVVAYHNSWPYFAQRFGLIIDLFLEPKPGIPPTPANLASVQSEIKAQHINVIIVEPYQNRKTAENVAHETGAVIVDVTQFPGGVKGTEGGYIELIDYLVKSIATAMEGESTGTRGK